MAIDIGKLTEEETFKLAVEALSFLKLEEQIKAIKEALDEDALEELAAQLDD
jgi:hypothetical protein